MAKRHAEHAKSPDKNVKKQHTLGKAMHEAAAKQPDSKPHSDSANRYSHQLAGTKDPKTDPQLEALHAKVREAREHYDIHHRNRNPEGLQREQKTLAEAEAKRDAYLASKK